MEIGAHYSQPHTDFGSDGEPWERAKVFELVVCPACYGVILRTYWWQEGVESEADIFPEILYPGETRVPFGLPTRVQKAFLSAQKVKPIDSNAFGVLIGRVVEEVCADRNAKGSTLADKLKDLAGRKEIPEKLVGVADGLRNFRNLGAHAELGELTPEEVPIVEDLCRALLDYLYTSPFLAQRAIDRLSALKRPKNSAGESPA
jgi:hypothetical protein